MFDKTSKSIGLIRNLQKFLLRPSLLQIYQSFVRPYPDYGDIIYDKAFLGSFRQKPETIQYFKAALATTRVITGTLERKFVLR